MNKKSITTLFINKKNSYIYMVTDIIHKSDCPRGLKNVN